MDYETVEIVDASPIFARHKELFNCLRKLGRLKIIDNDFANNLLREIVRNEGKIGHYKNIIGWLTLPLSYIPWVGPPIEKGANSLLGNLATDKIRKDKAWFYMLSEVNLSNLLNHYGSEF